MAREVKEREANINRVGQHIIRRKRKKDHRPKPGVKQRANRKGHDVEIGTLGSGIGVNVGTVMLIGVG